LIGAASQKVGRRRDGGREKGNIDDGKATLSEKREGDANKRVASRGVGTNNERRERERRRKETTF
jgi:hypothetical protein